MERPQPGLPRRVAAFALAVAFVLLALGVRLSLDPFLGVLHPYFLLYGAVVFSVWTAGGGPAVLAVVLGFVGADLLFIPPRGSFLIATRAGLIGAAVYIAVSAVIVALGIRMRRARERSESHARELERAMQDVRISEERFRLAARAAAMGTWDVDLIEGISHESEQIAPMFGRAAGTVHRDLGAFAAEVHPADRDRTLEAFKALLRGASDYHVEYRTLWPDGQTSRWVESIGTLLRDARGRPYRAVGCAFDVTERKQSESQRREQDALLRTMIHGLPVLISYIDPSFHYRINSQAYEKWFGVPLDQVTGHRVADVLGEEAFALKAPYLEQALAGEAVHFEALIPYKHGGPRWVSGTYVPHVVDGDVRGVISLVQDITDRRATEEALRRSDRAKDEFLAMLGHELRNPLAAVRNAIVTARLDSHRRERALDLADRQTEQLRHLVDDLLDVARITQGKFTLHKEPVFVADIVERAIETQRPTIDDRGHSLSVALPNEPARVDGDATRLQQVVANLLSNAAKYTEPGGTIDIAVTIHATQVAIRVRDNGIGIDRQTLAHVFDLFAQADRALDRAQGGLGIGLTVVRRLVELHGGSIEAVSPGLGCGSEFIVTLPRLHAPHEPVVRETSAPQRAGHRARVLIVEDNPDAAESLTMLLELIGHEVLATSDGPAALAAVRRKKPDVMLIDIGLPGMDGYEVARRLRGMPEAHGLVLIALTGYGRDDDQQRALAAGFDRHLVKPIDARDLEMLLSEVASERRARENAHWN